MEGVHHVIRLAVLHRGGTAAAGIVVFETRGSRSPRQRVLEHRLEWPGLPQSELLRRAVEDTLALAHAAGYRHVVLSGAQRELRSLEDELAGDERFETLRIRRVPRKKIHRARVVALGRPSTPRTQAAPARPRVHIYCDGACSPNPGLGGWGVVLIAPDKAMKKELSGAERQTTNNRMELMGAIEGLAALKTVCDVVIHTDSTYVMNAFEKGWIARWQRNGWRTAERTPVKNEDLWRRLHTLIGYHEVRWKWVRGHSGNRYNERADRLAVNARTRLGAAHPSSSA